MPYPLSLVKHPVFLIIYLIANLANAQEYNSSISAATAGTGRAAVEAADAAFLNPAALVHLRGHFLYGNFAENDFAVVLGDSSAESFLPSALAYKQKTKLRVGTQEWKESDISLSLAEFAKDKWAMGLTAHYLEFQGPTSSYRNINADLGLLYTPVAHIGWAAVVYNVMGEDKDIPEALRPETHFGLGFNYIYHSMVRFRADLTTKSEYLAGLETYLNRFIITRFGYGNNTDLKREILTAGAGFKGPRFAVNYAYQGSLEKSGDYRHSVDLEIPF